MRVLIADDSSVVRMSLRRTIAAQRPEARIDECGDGAALLKRLVANDYDVVFSDVYMPGMGGLDAVLAASEQGRRCFSVFMSTDMSRDIVEIADRIGAFEFVQKPFRAEEVAAVLDSIDRIRRPTRVLLVDDSRTVRRVIERVFERSLFNLVTEEAEDGPAAIARCVERPYDIVFLDVHMPGMDGFETLVEIRHRLPDVRVVLISAEDRRGILIRAGGLEIDGYLPKPFLPRDVDLVLFRLFGLKAPQLALMKAGASA